MKIPGVLVTAAIVGLYALLQNLAIGVQSIEEWWIPTALTLLSALIKWVDVQRPVKTMARNIEGESSARRFWLG